MDTHTKGSYHVLSQKLWQRKKEPHVGVHVDMRKTLESAQPPECPNTPGYRTFCLCCPEGQLKLFHRS